MSTASAELSLVSVTPGRMRLRWRALRAPGAPSASSILGALPGATRVRASSLTGSLLVEHVPGLTPNDVVAALLKLDPPRHVRAPAQTPRARPDGGIAAPGPQAPGRGGDHDERPGRPPRREEFLDAKGQLAGTLLGAGIVVARRITGRPAPLPGAATAVVLAATLTVAEGVPAFRHVARRTLGPGTADLAFAGMATAVLVLSGGGLGLVAGAVIAARELTELRARRAAWDRYRDQLRTVANVELRGRARLLDGERMPVAGVLLEGCGSAVGADGFPIAIAPGVAVPAGARLHGSTFAVELHGPPAHVDGAEPHAPVSPAARYALGLDLVALPLALASGLAARSALRALLVLYALSPRAALDAAEVGERGASARALRSGATVVDLRPGRAIRRPNLIVVDPPRVLLDGLEIAGVVRAGDELDPETLRELAARVSALAGSPWGRIGSQAPMPGDEQGRFDGTRAHATVAGRTYTLTVARSHTHGRGTADGLLLLRLRDERARRTLGTIVLRRRLADACERLVETCARHRVEIVVVDRPGLTATAQLAGRAGVLCVARGDTAELVADLRNGGARVAVLSDTPDAAPAFAAADLAIGLSAGRTRAYAARVDVLVPDLAAAAALVEAGARCDRATWEGVGLGLIGNAAGAALLRRRDLATVGLPVQVARLAGVSAAWLRLRGQSAHRSSIARLVDPRPERWGRGSAEEVMRSLDTSPAGLTAREAADRLRLPSRARGASPLRTAVVEQLTSPLTSVLAFGAGLSLLMGSVADVGLIAAVIVANASLGAAQEAQVARAAAALDRVTAATARVLRDGNHVSVPAQEVVPGDVLLLAHGDRVAADARLIAATGLEVNEAALSGESAHVAKHPDGPAAASRIVLAGTDVTVGHGRAVVFAVGPETRLGATAAALHVEPVEEGPLGVRLNRMVSQVLPVTGAAGLAILLSGLAWRRPLLTQLTLAASAAIAAVPEGLPLLAGIGQAAVARRLAARHALVRRLSAVEALGRVDVACVDKTGTLTEGRLSVERVLGPFEGVSRPDGLAPEHEEVLRAAAIASPGTGSSAAAAHATDVAVHRAMAAAGLADRHAEARLAEAPFDQSRPYHATLVESRLCAKGSTEALAGRCTHVRDQGAVRPLDDDGRRRLRERADELAALGLRVLIVAEGPPSTPPWDPRSLVALGFLAIRDAVRPGAVDAVRRCREAGVRMIMLTGDHPETARAIGLDVGLVDTAGSVLTGDEMADLTDTDLDARLADVAIIARISPLEKLRVVESLQRQGHTVAMTGDGVNDAPALRLADVGVAMGRDGTEVARQAAEIVLADDDVSTLVEGLIGGRAFWSNTRRALAMLLGGNLGEIAFITAIAVLGLPASLTTRQVLAVNLGSDVLPAISLAVQEPRSGDLAALSREGTAALGRPLWGEIARRGIATAVPALLAYLLTLRAQGPRQAQTVGFVSIVATQLAQTLDTGITEGGRVRPVVLAVGGSAALLGATVLVPRARAFLGLATPTPLGVAAIVLASALAIVMNRAAQASLPRKAGTAAVPA